MIQHRRVFSASGVANYLPDEATEHALGPAEPDEARQTIRLCMIVRNESQVIDRCVRSVRGLVDSWLVCDTGSTDDTPARVRAAFADLPGELHHHEWKDFGTNRSRLLELARGTADYLLLLDADHTVRLTGSLPHLDSEAYSLLVDESVAHWVPRLVRADLPWRYEGAAHEYLTCDQPHRVERLAELVVEHHADGGAHVNKVDRNRELLERHLWEHPDDSRSIFYLAQTLRDAGEIDGAIDLYARRIKLGGWPEELSYSHFRHAELVSRSDWDRGVGLLLKAWDYRPSRAEPLYELAPGYRVRGNYRLAEHFAAGGLEIPYPDDILLVHRDLYEWGLEFEWSIAAYWLGDTEDALAANDRLLSNPSVPASVRKVVLGNRQYCLDALERPDPASPTHRSAPEPGVDLTPTLTALMPNASLGEVRLATDPPGRTSILLSRKTATASACSCAARTTWWIVAGTTRSTAILSSEPSTTKPTSTPICR